MTRRSILKVFVAAVAAAVSPIHPKVDGAVARVPVTEDLWPKFYEICGPAMNHGEYAAREVGGGGAECVVINATEHLGHGLLPGHIVCGVPVGYTDSDGKAIAVAHEQTPTPPPGYRYENVVGVEGDDFVTYLDVIPEDAEIAYGCP